MFKLLYGPPEISEYGLFTNHEFPKYVSWTHRRKGKGCAEINHFSLPACSSVGVLMASQVATKTQI